MPRFQKLNLYLILRIFRIILGVLTALFLLFFGVANLISPEVSESYSDQNTRICLMMILTGIVAVYAIFRPLTGGILLCLFAVGLGFVFGGFLHNPITPVVMLLGGFFIISGYTSWYKLRKDPKIPA